MMASGRLYASICVHAAHVHDTVKRLQFCTLRDAYTFAAPIVTALIQCCCTHKSKAVVHHYFKQHKSALFTVSYMIQVPR
jgi:hypothetical protein